MHQKNDFWIFLILTIILIPAQITAQELAFVPEAKPINHIVAVVNEDVITRHELDEAIKTAISRMQQQGMQIPDQHILEEQVLESVITKRIQIQHAQEVGLSVAEPELDETINRIALDNQLTLPEFHTVLENDGISYNKFREEIREEMIIARLKEREVKHQVNVTEGEVDNFLQTQEASAVGDDEYRLAHIMILVPENMTADQIQQRAERAEMALTRLREGVEFSQIVSEFSDAADAKNGGIIEWRPISQMGPAFAQILEVLQPGDITSIVQSPNGFHIFKLLGRRAQETPTVIIDQTHARHILIKINELTSENDGKLKILALKDRLDRGESFEEVAKLYSEDASASSGGDLGWLSPGDTVPDFERVMNALLPGEISDPVRSQFGWHLIQVMERRTQDISLDRRRQSARQAIRTRKADVVIQDWLQQLRDQAYIEYRLDQEL
ncbi:peptidylprolyl isomerase [Nitrosomonas ureae]|uniref:Chaperone SurA n=1 Tax=Nitrosomonas ureae TaxID=44577 RepID=A0A0S3AIS7_9PROT|nr:peptidylprolyl isomerase [Nitrosomonas ureae]ALQ51069.1 molecular chaperone SurA [Nitrosomonas ureae]PTQ85073.1 periplasmic chaperone for outer membrane proteins SurA [Nitrosomonas ureae]SDU07808.1 periplasmic chaperone for outer membrane proteins SurA [Nitrosomonas ureae]SEQ26396.1 periplasmic chaperone for outer membrane proteins SurA [Nitrosomonas ureae]